MPARELFSLRLTQAQRRAVADLVPGLAGRLNLAEPNQRAIEFTRAEVRQIGQKARTAVRRARNGTLRRSLRHVADSAAQALGPSRASGTGPAAGKVFQFKITLLESAPPIWRRIQVTDCTLDNMHEHIQTAMGWTNSHLHHFRIGGQLYGDPMLMQENFEEMEYEDSTRTKLSAILPRSGRRFQFGYEYDFGDSWEHEVLFEGVVPAERGRRYPVCLEGERACPPEDVGGVWGYRDFLEAIADPDHEQHDELLEWSGGGFDPEAFDPAAVTREMRRGLPNWRERL